jgi:hypothetical protein
VKSEKQKSKLLQAITDVADGFCEQREKGSCSENQPNHSIGPQTAL